jgi:hypothetical protein
MSKKRDVGRKRTTFRPILENLEDRISPAILDTSSYGSLNPNNAAYSLSNPYNINQVYNADGQLGALYSAAKFPGT